MVGCLLLLVALVTPRTVLVVLWLLSDYLTRAFATFLWPFLGFLVLPTTTLATAVARNETDGGWVAWAIVGAGVLLDVGLLRGGRRRRRPARAER